MATQRVTIRLTDTITKEAEYDLDLEEFLEWSGGEQPTPKRVQEFIYAGREYDNLLDELWAKGRKVQSTVYPFPDVEEVRL